MKKFLVITLTLFVISVGIMAQDQSKEDKAMMEKWMKYATPNENHKTLEYFEGKWDTVSKTWMKPGDKMVETKGTYFSKMILGGRFLQSKMKGTLMGMPYEGFSVMGYDNLNKKFVGYWIDNASTGIFPIEGTLNKEGKVRTDTGNWDDIMTGGKSKVKMVTTILSKDKYKFEMFMILPDGKEFRSMEMIYTRKPCENLKK